MQFKLTPNPTFKVDVELSIPEAKGTQMVPFEFAYKNKEQLDAWFKSNKSKPTADALIDIVKTWGIVGADDLPAEINRTNMIDLLKNYPASGSEILAAYYNALTGSRAKN